MNKNTDTVIFLTACVNPKGMSFTKLTTPKERAKQYVDAIKYYIINTNYNILLVENTGYSFEKDFKHEVMQGRIELLTFHGNEYDRLFGKGYGEGLIVTYAIKHSTLLVNANKIIKITGRHIITNFKIIDKVIKITSRKPFIHFNLAYTGDRQTACSDMFIGTTNFFKKYLFNYLPKINDSQNYYFEDALYDAAKLAIKEKNYHFSLLPFNLQQQGLSGTTGEKLLTFSLYSQFKHFVKFILSLIIGYKL